MIAAVFTIGEPLNDLNSILIENIREVLIKVVIDELECWFFHWVVCWHDQLIIQEKLSSLGKSLDSQLAGLFEKLKFVVNRSSLGFFFGFFEPKQLSNLWQLIPSRNKIVVLQNAFEEVECGDQLSLLFKRQFLSHGLTFLLEGLDELRGHNLRL